MPRKPQMSRPQPKPQSKPGHYCPFPPYPYWDNNPYWDEYYWDDYYPYLDDDYYYLGAPMPTPPKPTPPNPNPTPVPPYKKDKTNGHWEYCQAAYQQGFTDGIAYATEHFNPTPTPTPEPTPTPPME